MDNPVCCPSDNKKDQHVLRHALYFPAIDYRLPHHGQKACGFGLYQHPNQPLGFGDFDPNGTELGRAGQHWAKSQPDHHLHLSILFSYQWLQLLALPLLDRLMPTETEHGHQTLPLRDMVMESMKLIFVVAGGLVVGLVAGIDLSWVDQASEVILLLLLFLIGIQLRNSGMTLKQILLNKKGIIIALTIIATSLPGGLIAAWLLDLPYNQGLAMASGFGWYSLAGILIGDSLGPVMGGVAFLNELLRELVALSLIPMMISRYPSTAIGYAGATAMDFTLPVIQNCGGIRCVPIAIVSGFILSLLVPVLMLFFLSL